MYFPYLRGKQFELIALKELNSILSKNRNKISPIIEPVKISSTIKTTLKTLATIKVNFNVIINPKVGDLQRGTAEILSVLHQELASYNNYQIAIIINDKDSHKTLIGAIKKSTLDVKGITLIHNCELTNIEAIVKEYETIAPVKYNVVHFKKTTRRYYRIFETGTVVELDDYFHMQQKNADYKEIDESGFSEEHLYYKDEGYAGFSDYLTIGDIYADSGFLPYAVAIHISYSDSRKRIKIKHFVSDSNDDNSDIAGKFKEALDQLVEWCKKMNLTTQAIQEFNELHRTGHFPGLGSVKKLSIMNHIEVVLRLI